MLKRDTEYYSKHVHTEHTHRVHKYTSIKHARLFIEKVYGNSDKIATNAYIVHKSGLSKFQCTSCGLLKLDLMHRLFSNHHSCKRFH